MKRQRRSAFWGGSWRWLGLLFAIGAVCAHAYPRTDQKTVEICLTETVEVPFPTVFELNRRLPPRHKTLVQEGKPGLKRVHWRVVMKNDKEVKRTLIFEETVRPPQPKVYLVGVAGHVASRGAIGRSTSFRTVKVLEMEASAYTPHRSGGGSGTGRTATGLPAGYGLVAVDPKVIPFGTVLYIEGYGMAIAADRGRAIRGNKIDLCFATRREALQFGRRKVRVHILQE